MQPVLNRQIALAMLARRHRFDGAAREALGDLAGYLYPYYGSTNRLNGYNRHLTWCHEDRQINRFASPREDRRGLRQAAAEEPNAGSGIIATPTREGRVGSLEESS